MPLKAGNMIHRVKVLAPPDPGQTDAMGQPLDNYTVVGERWAEVKDFTARRRRLFAGEQLHNEVYVEVIMHYTKSIKAGYRLQFGERILELIGPPADPTGLRRFIVCDCREVV